MKVYVVNHPSATWCEDYSVAVIAENSEHAIKLAREYSPDFKNATDINVEEYEINKERAILAANVGA